VVEIPELAEWRERVPGLAAECAARWQLEIGEPWPATFSWVAPVTRADGSRAVLKLASEQTGERRALQLWDGNGAVQVYDFDDERKALLLELVEPAEPLTSLPVDEALPIALEIGNALWRELPDDHGFTTIEASHAKHLDDVRADYERAPDLVDATAFEAAYELYASPPEGTTLLHGDLHTGNIRSARRRAWLAIDPGGGAGHKAWELGWLLVDPPRAGEEPVPDARSLQRRLTLLADGSGADEDLIRRCAHSVSVVIGLWAAGVGATATAPYLLEWARQLRA
jgi:streptomycin 6-kinase